MYNKNNSKYKLYLAGVITESQYYEILEKIENKMLLIENVGYAYVGNKGVLIPSTHDGGSITPPDSENTEQHVKQILEKYGYWYEGKGENIGKDSGFGKGSELKYCKDLGVPNPKNNGSYDDYVTMEGHWAGVPALTSIQDKWHGSVSIDAIGENSQTMGDAIRNILAQGHGTFANKGVNIKLPESDIQKIFAVIQQDFPNWQNQPLGGKKETEVYEFLRKIEDNIFEVAEGSTALSTLGWEAEHDREQQIVQIAMAKGGLFFLGKDHFTGPIIGKLMISSPIASNQLVN
jgi:hypothetical protein